VRVFGPLGVPEMLLIFVVALLLFGPRKMPQIGKSLGRALGEFRRASNEFKRTIEDEVAAEEIREVQRDLKDVRAVGRDVLRDAEPPSATDSPPSAPSREDDSGERDAT
jgi:TatA/E family protein of Tat protein translocase